MGERLLCKQEVIGSIPFTSTRADAGDRMSQITRTADRDPAGGCGNPVVEGDARRRPGLVPVPGAAGRDCPAPGGRGSGAGVD